MAEITLIYSTKAPAGTFDMGKIQFFTKEQQIIFDQIAQNDFLRSHFYFTGGTALSSFYLHHRESDDLDFFSVSRFDNQTIFTLMQEWGSKYHFFSTSREIEVTYVFNLEFNNKTSLKVDFGYYPYARLEKGSLAGNIEIDSLFDIAVNKLLTVSQRNEVKDFVDLYFLLQKFTVWDLRDGVTVKFKTQLEPFLLASDFLKAEDFEYLPKMTVPLKLSDLKVFFRQKAKELGEKAIK